MNTADVDSLYTLTEPTAPQFKLYPMRWVVVLILALLNGTSGYLWISFASIADHFLEYYETNEYVFNAIQLLFPVITVFLGVPASLLVDWLGIRFVLYFAASVNFICALLRILTSISGFLSHSSAKLGLIIAGQFISGLAQPLCMFAPTKLAVDWFPDRQRTLANAIGSLGNTIGVLVGSALAPLIVKEASQIPRSNYFSLGLTMVGLMLTCALIRRSKPPTPPSAAAALFARMRLTDSTGFRERLVIFARHMLNSLRCPPLWILMFSFGGGLAYFTTLSTLFEQILCAKGYSNQFAGWCGATMILSGILPAFLSAYFVDRTGLFLESVKICFLSSVLGCICLSVTLYFPNQAGLIIFFVIWIGAFGFAQYSLVLELAAEATFPIPESITSSLLVITSQLLSIIIIPVSQVVASDAKPNADFVPVCGPAATPKDYSLPNLIICGLLTLIGLIQLCFLRVTYKRREAALLQPGSTIEVNGGLGVETADDLHCKSIQ